jgi:hypothetical protein
MRFGSIIFALCLFPFVASQARSEDKRIAATLKAEDKYIEAYKRCIDKNFDLFSSSQQSAETIAMSVTSACSAVAQDYMQYLKTKTNVATAERTILELRNVARENVISRVQAARKK